MAIHAQPVTTDYEYKLVRLSQQPNEGDLFIWDQCSQSLKPINPDELRNILIKGQRVKRYFFANI